MGSKYEMAKEMAVVFLVASGVWTCLAAIFYVAMFGVGGWR